MTKFLCVATLLFLCSCTDKSPTQVNAPSNSSTATSSSGTVSSSSGPVSLLLDEMPLVRKKGSYSCFRYTCGTAWSDTIDTLHLTPDFSQTTTEYQFTLSPASTDSSPGMYGLFLTPLQVSPRAKVSAYMDGQALTPFGYSNPLTAIYYIPYTDYNGEITLAPKLISVIVYDPATSQYKTYTITVLEGPTSSSATSSSSLEPSSSSN